MDRSTERMSSLATSGEGEDAGDSWGASPSLSTQELLQMRGGHATDKMAGGGVRVEGREETVQVHFRS